jgi:hypothetical protein
MAVLLYVMLPTGKQARIFIQWPSKNVVTFRKLPRPFQDMLLVRWLSLSHSILQNPGKILSEKIQIIV